MLPGAAPPGGFGVVFESNDDREFRAELLAFGSGDYVLVWALGYAEPRTAIPSLDGLVESQLKALQPAG